MSSQCHPEKEICQGCFNRNTLRHNFSRGDIVCFNCGMVAEERCIDYTTAGYRIFENDDASDSEKKKHHGVPINIFMPNAQKIEEDGKNSNEGDVKYMANCQTLLRTKLHEYFEGGSFPGQLYESALEIMLICGKPENRTGKQTPKDIRYNLYTSLLLSILVGDLTFGIPLDKSTIILFVEFISGVSMQEPSLAKRINMKFMHEDVFRNILELRLNINPVDEIQVRTSKKKKMQRRTNISLTKKFDLGMAIKSRERRLRSQHALSHRLSTQNTLKNPL